MKHFYHGLFGSPKDWDCIVSDGPEIMIHDLYQEKTTDILSLKTGPEDILVGYSMGGRIAIEIARKNQFNLSKLLLLSTHPGLSEGEKEERIKWEDSVLDKMHSMTAEAFKKFWDGLDLFQSSQMDQQLSETKLRDSARLFKELRLSKMPLCLEQLIQNKSKVTWVLGQHDSKYITMLAEKVRTSGIETLIVETDHRVLRDKTAIKNLFSIKGIL